MRIVFTCGGTAGHINPALGVAGRIRELMPGTELLFIGAEGHMETELIPREGYAFETVRIDGFQRSLKPKMLVRNMKTAGLVVRAVRDARSILRDFGPDAAVGTGGYVCYPVLRAAASLGIPTAVHESNAMPGLTTRLLEGSVSKILVGFEECRGAYKHPERVEVTGTPVRAGFRHIEKEKARAELGLSGSEPIVLAVFGSLGAGDMNRLMGDFIRRMGSGAPFRLIYATGKQYYDSVRDVLSRSGLHTPMIDVREYIYDMPKVMAAADVILCRSGASTVSELTCLGKPAVLVPSPNVVSDHQTKNARVLAEAGAAVMLPEAGLTGEKLYDSVAALLRDDEGMRRMHEASVGLGVRDAADRIASIVMGLAEKER